MKCGLKQRVLLLLLKIREYRNKYRKTEYEKIEGLEKNVGMKVKYSLNTENTEKIGKTYNYMKNRRNRKNR